MTTNLLSISSPFKGDKRGSLGGALLLFLLCLCVSSWAAPARPGQWKMILLADGTEVRAELKGDEHCHYWQTEDGRIFTEDADKPVYKEISRENLTYSLPMNFATHGADTHTPMRVLGKPHTQPVEGTMKGLVVLVEFSDVKFLSGHDKELYTRILNEQGYKDSSTGFVGSVNDYFMDQSDGRFDYQFDVIGPVTLSNKATYYGGESGYDHMKNFVTESLNLIKADTDFSVYDNDKDGYVDEIFFVFAGKGANDGGTNCIWPHMYWYKSAWGGYFKQNRTYVDTYACANEIDRSSGITGIGTFCHEFSHCLDIPDMYDTVAGENPLGHYSVMDVGCYNGNGFVPAGYNAYEREFCGWREIEELTDNATFDNLQSISEGGKAYKMTNHAQPDEYFIIEPRSQTSWDKNIYGSGFLIYHVDYNTKDWLANVVNTPSKNETSHNNIEIVRATKGTSYESYYTFPRTGVTSFDDYTSVHPELYYDNLDGSRKLHKGIYDMKVTNGTFSFRYEAEAEYTGIDDIPSAAPRHQGIYNLSGQRVTAVYKGLLLINGRKVLQ